MRHLLHRTNTPSPKRSHAALQRRLFLKRAVGVTAITSFNLAAPSLANTLSRINGLDDPSYFSAGKNSQGEYCLIRAYDNAIKQIVTLPGRAHEILVHPTNTQVLVIARRPGNWCMIVDTSTNQHLQTFNTQLGSHFYGHASFDLSGRFLITTENDIKTGEGKIVIRDSLDSYAITQSFSSYGIGPHQLRVMPSGNSLVVANGGILTHPDKGRKKLNIDSMRPNLSFINLDSGGLSKQLSLPEELHQLSIRHLDVNALGDVAIAMQYQGDVFDNVPLVAIHRSALGPEPKKSGLEIIDIPRPDLAKMRAYCGSVCFDTSGKYIAVSAPRGDLVVFFDFYRKRYISSVRIPDGCGIASSEAASFDIASGRGKLYRHSLHSEGLLLSESSQYGSVSHQPTKSPRLTNKKLSFDNHLSVRA